MGVRWARSVRTAPATFGRSSASGNSDSRSGLVKRRRRCSCAKSPIKSPTSRRLKKTVMGMTDMRGKVSGDSIANQPTVGCADLATLWAILGSSPCATAVRLVWRPTAYRRAMRANRSPGGAVLLWREAKNRALDQLGTPRPARGNTRPAAILRPSTQAAAQEEGRAIPDESLLWLPRFHRYADARTRPKAPKAREITSERTVWASGNNR